MPSDLLAAIMDASLPRASPRMALHLSKWMPGVPREDDDQVGGVEWPAQDVLAAAAFLL